MNRNRLNILLVLVAAALAASGCGGGERTGNNSVTTTASNTNAASQVAADQNGANVAPANGVAVAPSQTAASGVVVASPQQAASQGSASRGASNAPPAKNMPKPQIGSGGNDFYLFTQARAALNADAELKSANIVVDIKEGSATLSGAVRSAEQKSRAEQLVQAAGLKTVKNQLRVSAGN